MNTKYYDNFSIDGCLKDIIFRTLNIQVDNLTEEEKNYPLLSRKFGFLPYQMLVLFIRIEGEMHVQFSEISVANGKFNSYNNILEMVKESIESQT